MSRHWTAIGIWPEMLEMGCGVTALALRLGLTPHGLRPVLTARASLHGPHARLAILFAREHGIQARLYIHPGQGGLFLLSSADGWRQAGSDGVLLEAHRRDNECWTGLSALEIPIGSSLHSATLSRMAQSMGQNAKSFPHNLCE